MTSLTWLSAPDAILGAGDIAGQMMLQTAIDAVVGDQRGLLGKGQKREKEGMTGSPCVTGGSDDGITAVAETFAFDSERSGKL